jgi:hypothetical protein
MSVLSLEVGNYVVINCVINLISKVEKHLSFKKIFYFLKPSSRLVIVDTIVK